ncbi:hypothetical protein QQ008_20190 [Fulvivirgaceae bacterium BMA10]|uniref:Uncharacterized protein n=1 Tax=Splendidivirga corallicola TaxID=3051826 RepID=A0ABT8KSI1_9BACT|nr:hypothetical protein [Fulvivirgaceae bacterium BMA10]
MHFKSVIVYFLLFIAITFKTNAQEIPSKEDQIAAAILAAPEEMREGVTVLGYDRNGKVVTLKEGTNDLICLADDPNKPGFNAASYHKDLEPFMARGRALKAEGKSFKEIFDMREAEVKAGTLKMPSQPTTLHILFGPEGKYDATSGKVLNARYRFVVYIPYATPESTGLPTKPREPGDPWIMDPGTHRAHIMITPKRN